ncbi:4'-phosphopantetheinyl transferase family protein [Streptomyces cellulosae]|uniref:4'-phosphopantetheinyl transferase family protein n=1 Tax=Streptomyces cellulosae TaxID=1968 RepID=UPI000AB1C0DF|nr:4'-phosphopantetheinyl transferase superfamily protein [Streptomyces cellulosae]
MQRALIERLLPSYVAGAEARSDAADDALHPEERSAVAGVSEGRRREFTTVRHCARRALSALGHAPAPLIPDARGVPRWPDGVVGSMTHCRGYRAAVVARQYDMRALGVDAEPWRPLSEGVLGTVSLPGERERLAALEASYSRLACWDRLLFCAKEAVYKAWFPDTGTELTFRDVSVEFDPTDHTFRATVLAPYRRDFTGRWLARDGILLAVAFDG